MVSNEWLMAQSRVPIQDSLEVEPGDPETELWPVPISQMSSVARHYEDSVVVIVKSTFFTAFIEFPQPMS